MASDLKEEFRKQYLDDDTTDSAWQVEFITREFRKPKTRKCWFKYPLHVLAGDELNTQYAKGEAPETKVAHKNSRKEKLISAYEVNNLDGNGVALDVLAEYLEMSTRTMRRYIAENTEFVIKDNIVKLAKNRVVTE